MLYFQRTRGIAIIFALWFVSPSASPHGIRTVSASDTLTGILSRATSIASTQANEYCSTNEDTAFNITIDNHLQRIFAIDQALRFQLFASIDKAKWLSKIHRFDQAESKYVSNLSKDHQSRKQILSSSQGSFELFLVALHIAQIDPKAASQAEKYFYSSKKYKYYATFIHERANQPIQKFDLNDPNTIHSLSDHLPKRNDKSCYMRAVPYYRDHYLAQDNSFVLLLLREPPLN